MSASDPKQTFETHSVATEPCDAAQRVIFGRLNPQGKLILSSERFLLCRPQGGLNDVLCNVERARRYADKFNRTLIVDTNFINAKTIKDDFSNYFYTADDVILNLRTIKDRLCDLTVFPTCVAGKLDSYQAYYDNILGNYAERTTGEKISFEFGLDYGQQLLVQHASGGGVIGVDALSWLRLNEVISAELIRRLKAINAPYIAVHIRHTDFRTDYVYHLNLLKSQLATLDCTNLFVATDNIECVQHCKTLFPSLNIFSFSALPKIATPLHHGRALDPSRRFEVNADSILDLLMLALSRHFVIMPLKPGSPKTFSGFSRLAHNLRTKQEVLHRLAPDVLAKVNFVDRVLPIRSVVRGIISRNTPCPCSSGKRYKHCCGSLT
jgi:hypothetical protein